MKLFPIVLALIAMPVAACAQEAPKAPERSQDAKWHNEQMLALAGLKAADGWRTLPGNIRWKRLAGDGKGAHPTVADMVTLHYAGRLTDGTEFDSSYARNEPATFPLGRLIKGWQAAVPEMGVGDTIEVVIPADRYVCLQLPSHFPTGQATVTVRIQKREEIEPASGPELDPDRQDIEWWDEFEDNRERIG